MQRESAREQKVRERRAIGFRRRYGRGQRTECIVGTARSLRDEIGCGSICVELAVSASLATTRVEPMLSVRCSRWRFRVLRRISARARGVRAETRFACADNKFHGIARVGVRCCRVPRPKAEEGSPAVGSHARLGSNHARIMSPRSAE